MPTQLRIEVLAERVYEEEMVRASAALMTHDMVQVDFAGRDLWMVAHDVVDKGVEAGQRFTAIVQDMDSGRVLRADGRFDELDYASLINTDWQRPPSEDEFAWAVGALQEDPTLGPALAAGDLEPYRPMPPLANLRDPDGNVDRVVAVGLRSPTGEHRIVGVLTADGEVIREPTGVPGPSSQDSGAPRGPAAPGVPGERQARLRVWQGDEPVWDLVVVRPSASSGTNGSGVELRTVDYRGARVLHRAHLPIVNVEFGDDGVAAGCERACRQWAHEEAAFEAEGDDPVTGFRLCTAPPRTVLESGVDGGGFRGVALWADGEELVIVSQLQAGPYRYVSEWRLGADGTIRPRLGFSAASNSCTGHPHVHHAYWRFDFDILSPESNVLREYNDPPIRGETRWHLMRFEVKRPRDPAHNRFWRIRHDRDGRDYSIMPGPNDGLAAETGAGDFAAGDVWILRYDPDELDDNQGFTTDPALARPGLDRFVSGEPVHSRDMVVWYGVHVAHPAEEADGAAGDRVGPELVAGHWATVSYVAPELLEDS